MTKAEAKRLIKDLKKTVPEFWGTIHEVLLPPNDRNVDPVVYAVVIWDSEVSLRLELSENDSTEVSV